MVNFIDKIIWKYKITDMDDVCLHSTVYLKKKKTWIIKFCFITSNRILSFYGAQLYDFNSANFILHWENVHQSPDNKVFSILKLQWRKKNPLRYFQSVNSKFTVHNRKQNFRLPMHSTSEVEKKTNKIIINKYFSNVFIENFI